MMIPIISNSQTNYHANNRTSRRRVCDPRGVRVRAHRWNTNPRPQPETFGKLVSLMQFSQSYIFLNWLSGFLLGVGNSDFIGNVRGAHALPISLAMCARVFVRQGSRGWSRMAVWYVHMYTINTSLSFSLSLYIYIYTHTNNDNNDDYDNNDNNNIRIYIYIYTLYAYIYIYIYM